MTTIDFEHNLTIECEHDLHIDNKLIMDFELDFVNEIGHNENSISAMTSILNTDMGPILISNITSKLTLKITSILLMF